MAKTVAASPTAPLGIRILLMALLPLIALAVYVDGQFYDPDLTDFAASRDGTESKGLAIPETLAGLSRFGQTRRFDEETLYEYINGHAEYFLGAGFRGLRVIEYGDSGNGQPTLVINLYDMGAALNAFGVLIDEAGDQTAVDIGAMGFANGRGLTFIQGRYYVQVTVFDDDTSAQRAGMALAEALDDQTDDNALAFSFPDLGEVRSTRYVKEDYRGLEFLNGVLERELDRDGKEIQVFLVQASTDEIAALVQAFETFFAEDEMPYTLVERDGLAFYAVDDPYEGEWFFVPSGDRLIGVYAPLDDDLAAEIGAFAGLSED